jgi:serine/threonine protein kinase
MPVPSAGLAEPLKRAHVASAPTDAWIDLDDPKHRRVAGFEPIPGYRLVMPLGQGGCGEVWKCEAPGGIPKAIKFVSGGLGHLDGRSGPAKQELQALERCKAIRHPFILSMERLELIGPDLVIVMELADRSLHDVLADYQAAGHPGIPRAELLTYLREVAEVLDFLQDQHGLQHLDIKPRNLFLIGQHIKVADFGLASSLAELNGLANHATSTPLYGAPETFNGKLSPRCDQYSLAVSYYELLTGKFPFQGKNPRQVMMQHITAEPQLGPLPESDRASVGRALSKEASARFPSCLAFIHSLMPQSGVFALPALGITPSRAHSAETVNLAETPSAEPPRPATHAIDTIPGYELLKCVSQSSVGDVWQARAPDGRDRLALLLNATADRGDLLVSKLRPLRHALLPASDVLRTPMGRVGLVCDPWEQTLMERFQECRKDGQPGIPRTELLGYLTEIAKGLDDLQREHKLPHGCLQPRNILVHHEHAMLFQHGLVPLLCAGKPAGALNPRYAAPELFEAPPSAAADQYSLALIYAEMLLGMQPRSGRLGAARGPGKLDLDLLPAFDRPVLARALQADPARRFPTCAEFAGALNNAAHNAAAPTQTAIHLADITPLADLTEHASAPSGNCSSTDVVSRWLVAATGALKFTTQGSWHYLSYPGHIFEHRYPVHLIPGVLKLKLHDFPKKWPAYVVRKDDNAFVCRLPSAPTVWQRFSGRESGLEVQVLIKPLPGPNQMAEAQVRVQPYGAVTDRTAKESAELGPQLIASVRSFLDEQRDQRRHLRWACTLPLRIYPVKPNLHLGERRDAVCRDLALDSIGFRVAEPLPTEFVYVAAVDVPGGDDVALLVHVKHSTPCPEGGHDLGGIFGAHPGSPR